MGNILSNALLPLAVLVTLWSAPLVISTVQRPEALVPGQYCGTGWKGAHESKCQSAWIALALSAPLAVGLMFKHSKLNLLTRVVAWGALLTAIAHTVVAFFGPSIATAF